jgi:hypothetical protein
VPGLGGLRTIGGAGDSEVEELHFAIVTPEHVPRLDVTMQDPARVRVPQPLQNGLDHGHGSVHGERPVRQALVEVLPAQELEHHGDASVLHDEVAEPDDVRVPELVELATLPLEGLDEPSIVEERPRDDLDRHAELLVVLVHGLVDFAVGPRAEFAGDGVVGDGGGGHSGFRGRRPVKGRAHTNVILRIPNAMLLGPVLTTTFRIPMPTKKGKETQGHTTTHSTTGAQTLCVVIGQQTTDPIPIRIVPRYLR